MNPVNIEQLYAKLREQGNLDTEEVLTVLAELNHFRGVAAYLATCHAATAESDGMLKKTSLSSKKRHAGICNSAVEMLQMKSSANSHPLSIKAAVARCERAARSILEEETCPR